MSSTTSTACRRPGRSPTTTSSPGTPRPSGSTRCTATAARTRPRAIARRTIRGRPCRTSRASNSSSTICRKGGYHPFHAPCGVLLDEAHRAKSTCIRCTWCDGYPCLVHAKSDAETIAVRPIIDLPNVTLLVNAEVVRLDTDRRAGSVTDVVVRRGGVDETYQGVDRGRLGRRVEHGQAAARVGQRRAPRRSGQRLGPGRPELHVPQQQSGGGPVGGGERHASTRRPSGSTTSTSGLPTTTTRSATSRWSASPTRRP